MQAPPRLTVNTFLALIIKAKKKGSGKYGNGELLVELTAVLSDLSREEIRKRFTSQIHAEGKQNLRTIAGRIRDNKAKFPYPNEAYGITVDGFTRLVRSQKPSGAIYSFYLERMSAFIQNVLDKSCYSSLVYTLLELLRHDDSFSSVYYNNQHIEKGQFFGTSAHPKRICLEAFLAALWYHSVMTHHTENARELELLPLQEQVPFQVFLLGVASEYIFRQEYSVLEKRLDLNAPVALKENLHRYSTRPHAFKKPLYPLQIRIDASGEIILSDELISHCNHPVFLYAAGGFGKSTILLQQIDGNIPCFFLPLNHYQTEQQPALFPNASCWILLHILLKYHYQNAYQTYEMCSACEGADTILQQLTELHHLLCQNPNGYIPEFTLLLDGMNELPVELQDALASELTWICHEWKNVRLIVSGRNIPAHDIFKEFDAMEVIGIPDDARNQAISHLPDYEALLQNERLLDLLKSPLFLNLYLDRQNSDTPIFTRGEILDAYVKSYHPKTMKNPKALRFLIQYALPFLAKKMQSHFEIDRAALTDAIENAYSTYLQNNRVYQNYIAPQGYRKSNLIDARENCDFVELLLENECFLTVSGGKNIRFTHQYFRDYFAARHFVNLLEAVQNSYDDREKQCNQIHQFFLAELWFYDEEMFGLLGEICGDYLNVPDAGGRFEYHFTILDWLLDVCRELPDEPATVIVHNIMKTMCAARNHVVCGVDFSRLPVLIPADTRFSINGAYPSVFYGCCVKYTAVSDIHIDDMTYASDGKSIQFLINENRLLVWDVERQQTIFDDFLHDNPVRVPEYALPDIISANEEFSHAKLSPNRRYCAAIDFDGELRLIDLSTNSNYAVSEQNIDEIWISNRHLLYSVYDGSQIISAFLYDIAAKTKHMIYHTRSMYPARISAAFSPDETHFLLCADTRDSVRFIQYDASGGNTPLPINTYFPFLMGCNFVGAAFQFEENEEIIRRMGAIVDGSDEIDF